MPAEYEAEQSELTEFVQTEQAAVDTYERDKADFNSFVAIICKYVWIQELTPTVVNEFVKKIIVYAPDKSSGHRRQKIEIVWNFIGELEQNEDEHTIERQSSPPVKRVVWLRAISPDYRPASKGAGFLFCSSHYALTSFAAPYGAFVLLATLKRVFVFFHT